RLPNSTDKEVTTPKQGGDKTKCTDLGVQKPKKRKSMRAKYLADDAEMEALKENPQKKTPKYKQYKDFDDEIRKLD
ncbi:hypothetical protein, partial [Flammeovirga sp. OC4]|uniref:hypothetical protein n=1 Tax=Flammeovirga sp. OC4 TaxID=1382345 RepID=UPI0005C5E2E1